MENKLAVIVKESKLEPTKAKIILEKFQDYFEIASEWEKKVKTLVVTDAKQKALTMARAWANLPSGNCETSFMPKAMQNFFASTFFSAI